MASEHRVSVKWPAQLLLCRAHRPTYAGSGRHAPARHEMPAGGTTFVASSVPVPVHSSDHENFLVSRHRDVFTFPFVRRPLSLHIIDAVRGRQSVAWRRVIIGSRKCRVIFVRHTENSQPIASASRSVDTVSAFRLHHSFCIV